jgi:hypothetical protein
MARPWRALVFLGFWKLQKNGAGLRRLTANPELICPIREGFTETSRKNGALLVSKGHIKSVCLIPLPDRPGGIFSGRTAIPPR